METEHSEPSAYSIYDLILSIELIMVIISSLLGFYRPPNTKHSFILHMYFIFLPLYILNALLSFGYVMVSMCYWFNFIPLVLKTIITYSVYGVVSALWLKVYFEHTREVNSTRYLYIHAGVQAILTVGLIIYGFIPSFGSDFLEDHEHSIVFGWFIIEIAINFINGFSLFAIGYKLLKLLKRRVAAAKAIMYCIIAYLMKFFADIYMDSSFMFLSEEKESISDFLLHNISIFIPLAMFHTVMRQTKYLLKFHSGVKPLLPSSTEEKND